MKERMNLEITVFGTRFRYVCGKPSGCVSVRYDIEFEALSAAELSHPH